MTVGMQRLDLANADTGVHLHARREAFLEYSADELKRMIGSIARDKTPDVVAVESEFIPDLNARPDFNLLALFGSQNYFFAHCLSLIFRVRQIEPAPGRKVPIDVLIFDDLRHTVAISESNAEDD